MESEEVRWATDYPFSNSQQKQLDHLKGLVQTRGSEIDPDLWIPVIHNCMKSFINLEETRKQIHESNWALYRFLVSVSINPAADGFNPPASVPHIVKKLVFCVRANVFEQARTLDDRDEWDMDVDGQTLTSDGGLFGLKRYIIDKGETPFNSIRWISNRAARHAANEPDFGFANWYLDPEHPERYNVLSIYGKTIKYSTFLNANESLISQADKVLFLDILGGVQLPPVDLQVYQPMDDMRERGYHKSVFTSPNNIYVKYKIHLVDEWMSNNRTRAKMVRGVVEGKVVWKRSAVMKWLDKCLLYLGLLLVAMQVNWGGPARFSEIPCLRISNGQLERRNTYFHDGWLMFLFRYNKTRSMQGKDRNIPRYLPPVLQKQFVYYMTLVRPAIVYFLNRFQLPGRHEVKEFLFVDHKIGLWKESQVIRKWTNIMTGLGLGVLNPRIYRQTAQLIMDKRVKFKWELPDEDNALDESFGHSSAEGVTGYAVEADVGDLVRKDDLAHFRMGCFKWFCETIPNKSVRGALAKRSREDDLEGEIEVLDMAAKEPATPRRLLSNVVNVLTPPSIDTAEALARSQLPTVRPMINPDVKISAKTIVALRTLLNSPTAGFKSVYQARAVQLYLNRQTDLFVILPTSGGKSLTFELAPLLEPEGTTILIIPFVALMTEMRKRVKKALPTFRAEQWLSERDSLSDLPHLLLVSVEEATSTHFQSFVLNANTHGCIYRFVIDEFHVLLTQADFRPKMLRLVTTLRLLQVPVVCLSATIPEPYIDRIRIQLASVHTTVIRAPTDRSNLKYDVCRLATDALEELDDELFRRLRDSWRHVEDKENSRFIVYCHTAKAAEAFTELVNQHHENIGFSATIYHSKMERQVKEMSYSKWKRGEVKLLVGTGAIGAGMDYAHVRGVWHRGFTSSLVDYIQEVGRAGRDGEEAICVLLHSPTVEAECRRFMVVEDMDRMSDYVEEAGCLRSHLTKFIDGLSIDCFSSDAVHCMHCEVALARESLELSTGSQKTFDGGYNGSLNQIAFRDLTRDRDHILSNIRMVMHVLETRCGVCWFTQRIGRLGMDRSINHDVTKCPHMKSTCIRCYRIGHVASRCRVFHNGLVFDRGCCHKCGFPQNLFGERVHGFPQVGGCDREGLRDKLSAVGWMCWRYPNWKRQVGDRFGLGTLTDQGFMEWLGAFGEHGIVNAVALCVWFHSTFEEEDDGLDDIHLS